MEENKFLPNLSQNLLEILDDDEYFDIIIEVGDDPYVEIFRAHMVILSYRSPYLRRILSINKPKINGILHIKLSNILPEIFQIILRYIYGGKISLIEYDTPDIIKILIAANTLSIQELIPHLQLYLIENKTKWLEQNFNLIYQMSFENYSFLELQKFCTELISKQPEKIFNAIDYTSISEEFLISLLQHDNLHMSEIQIWDHIIKWGISQNPELSSDPSNYSNNDFIILKNILQQCIPFIKFKEFTAKEFLTKVYPYKKILPEKFQENLIECFLDNNYKPSKKLKIDSKIITIQHVELISKWIDKLEFKDNIKNSYEFKLIFRGSRDGFTPKNFHDICDNQSHTISIIKVRDSNEILGGYNPIIWKSGNSYGITDDSFIFSFKNNYEIENHILSRVEDENRAINYCYRYGSSFGNGDLIITSFGYFYNMNKYNTNYCAKGSYEKQIRNTQDKFSIEEYEIFQINI
ncbi:hypothetical protein C1645_820933 [Glomus cerebriforme]|uniref:Kelch-like protein 17 n=1 Tax=Glomus cerebriforme TaxID=658196 RepID=A0A397T4J4_9GLOM|nr:hypothetical protein C1645_820933 [Glomus cerebriforme]